MEILGGEDLQIRSLLDRNQFHDPDGQAEALGISSAQWPLFGQIWPAARVLANVMQAFDVGGMRILELGCGLALGSLVAHRRGADVICSDCHPMVEGFLQENVRLNHMQPLAYRDGNWATNSSHLGRFDLIIGSDVLYERNHANLLSHFIDEHAELHAQVVIVDPNRGNRAAFARRMEQDGFSAGEMDSERPPNAEIFRGRILMYSR